MKDRSVEERTPRARLNANRGEAGQLARLKSAALLVRVGLDHEPWLRRALARLGDGAPAPGGPRGLDLSRSITLLQTETPRLRADAAPHQHGFGNPHDWLDPENARPSSWPGAASWSPATAWCCARCARRRESVSATG
ncbi:MAG: hypothetical protein DMD80_02435 [Candidatus Rokuibacteriota bacterium]|nr:MAG: hypothetical protein DMD80_02435 [Candidatus Rokubacteria bacterium]